MVPLDEETVTLIDRIAAHRSPGQPIPHPRTGKPAEFLLTHHGRRLSPEALRGELARAAKAASAGHVTPTRCATPMPPPWSTPASRCKASWPCSVTCQPR